MTPDATAVSDSVDFFFALFVMLHTAEGGRAPRGAGIGFERPAQAAEVTAIAALAVEERLDERRRRRPEHDRRVRLRAA